MALDFSKTATAASLALASLFSHTAQAAEPAPAQQTSATSASPIQLPNTKNYPMGPAPSLDFVTATGADGKDVKVEVTACRTSSNQGVSMMGISIAPARKTLDSACVTAAIEAAGAKPKPPKP